MRTIFYDVYAEVSGRPRGHGTGLLRDVIIADTDEEAMALWRELRPVLRARVVRAVRLPARHAGPEDGILPDAGGSGA